jgi:N-acetylglucosaminyldiphosphoundecaprenol N-acetyl-beta-D-mannosaminyltransferase
MAACPEHLSLVPPLPDDFDAPVRVDVLGVPVSAGTMDDALDEVSRWVVDGDPSYGIFRDVHGVMESQRRPEVLDAHLKAGLVACDGTPLVWASRWAGVKSAQRVYGPDFVLAMCARAEDKGWKSFFYGGKPGVAEKLGARLQGDYPNLQVVGAYSPPFRALTPDEDAAVVEMIDASGADLVWVGLSTPKQELWMADHVGRLQAPALLGVGAAVDFLTGEVRQAPRWIHNTGLEWAFRMAMEPRRLGRRYLKNNPAFVRAILSNRPHILPNQPREILPASPRATTEGS